ncbi:MAG: 2OG-Fe(II) oxygenase family protein [Pseudomonadota bacterium]|nr:2OG-Fe(II) oxygenase family protein [Pseudomonadota bacterium]
MLVNYQHTSKSQNLHDILLEYGFSDHKTHPLDSTFINHVYSEWLKFFLTQEKELFLYDKTSRDGFYPMQTEVAEGHSIADLKEFFMYYPKGQCPEYLKQDTQDLYAELTTISQEILDILWENLPYELRSTLPLPLGEMIDVHTRTVLRILHYPALNNTFPENAIRAYDHTDINLITLIPRTTAPGLQVKKQADWVDIPFGEEWLTMNIGDMLQAYTKGYYTSTVHRVLNPLQDTNTPRLSMPFFVHPRDDDFISEQYPKSRLFLDERLKNNGVI